MSRFSSAKKAKKDVEPLLRQRGKSSVRSKIHLLRNILEKGSDDDKESFLSSEKGFRPEQYMWDLSLFHYVAGRVFETADQASDWLSYAIEQKKQDIEMKSFAMELRPLHCACKRGNIFGVEWLVSRGAKINVKDGSGHTPYSYACASSVDTMKKVVYLEEHVCILSPCDMVLAAENRFSSIEKADKIFHHLVNKKGLSVNAIEEEDWKTPLHRACEKGSIFGVKWLVEHNADINSADKAGRTPFMLACSSEINRSKKVRYLGEKGADCRTKDHKGNTALFYATYNDSKCEDGELKDVFRYLIIEKGIDTNSVDEEEDTALLAACCYRPSFVVIEQLIELGADLSVRNKDKHNALHIAARNPSGTDRSIIDLLLKKGVDVTCEDKLGQTPHQVAHDGEIRALLRQHYDAARFSVLQREKVRPVSIKVCLIGDEMAGKTTLVNSLLRLCLPPPKEEDRTPGVEIHNRIISGVGKGSIWDFGAQPTFHSAHGLFFRQSNTIFVLVLRFRDGQQMTSEIALLRIARYWCAFVKAALRTLFSNLTSRLRLFIVSNLIDFEEDAGIEVSYQLKRVAHILQEEFKNTFKISCMFEMDCSKTSSHRMNDFRRKLKAIREQMLEKADDVPKLCQAIERNLCLPDKERKSSLRYFLTLKEFDKWVVEHVGITLNQDETKVSPLSISTRLD